MIYILEFAIGGLSFLGIFFIISGWLQRKRSNSQKGAQYECGELPKGSAWAQTHVRFYIICFVFLLFEIEIIFLFPWAVIHQSTVLSQAIGPHWGLIIWLEALLFIAFLSFGLAYVWVKGHLDGLSSSFRKPPIFHSPVPHEVYAQYNQKQKQRAS